MKAAYKLCFQRKKKFFKMSWDDFLSTDYSNSNKHNNNNKTKWLSQRLLFSFSHLNIMSVNLLINIIRM